MITALPPDDRAAPPPPIVEKPAPAAQPRDVAILFSDEPNYAEVASELRRLLPAQGYRPVLVDLKAKGAQQMLGTLGKKKEPLVAIGLPAARYARDHLSSPVVFAQVFNYEELLPGSRPVRGVAPMPAFGGLLQDWKRVDPNLRRVGIILSAGHDNLVREVREAGEATGLTIRHEASDSDRETLYVFKRLAPQLDGLLLVPDDRILSPNVLRELLGYAVSHGVRVCVFSEDLLEWGAFLSARPTPAGIARSISNALEDLNSGKKASTAIIPASETSIRINEEVADRLGLSLGKKSSWVVGVKQ